MDNNEDLIQCKECGENISLYMNSCPKCGTKCKDMFQLERHGFVTFWIWLCIASSGLIFLANLVGFIMFPKLLTCLYIFLPILNIVGYIMLLKWNNIGLVLIVGQALINMILNQSTNEMVNSNAFMIGIVIGLAILLAILKIKKNGISYLTAMRLKKNWAKA